MALKDQIAGITGSFIAGMVAMKGIESLNRLNIEPKKKRRKKKR